MCEEKKEGHGIVVPTPDPRRIEERAKALHEAFPLEEISQKAEEQGLTNAVVFAGFGDD